MQALPEAKGRILLTEGGQIVGMLTDAAAVAALAAAKPEARRARQVRLRDATARLDLGTEATKVFRTGRTVLEAWLKSR